MRARCISISSSGSNPLDYLLYAYPKPYVALMDGITMGGGMGIAQGSTLRIVGDRTRIAMPEVAIGFFPDVGGSYFLPRLPGALGIYLGLTGVQIRGADALYCQLADVYLPADAVAALAEGPGPIALERRPCRRPAPFHSCTRGRGPRGNPP